MTACTALATPQSRIRAMPSTPHPIAQQLRRARRRVDRTQSDVAEAIATGRKFGVYHGTISEWETGRAEPKLSDLTRWAGTLGYQIVLLPIEAAL